MFWAGRLRENQGTKSLNVILYFSSATVVFREGRPDTEEILSLAHEMKNWKQLGRALRLKDPQLDEIDDDVRGLFEKSYAMLRKWMETRGSAATYAEMARGLEIVGRRDLIRNFCKKCELPNVYFELLI